MNGLVWELQALAQKEEAVSGLLRHAYTIARKLKIKDAEWIWEELSGFEENNEWHLIPKYRHQEPTLKTLIGRQWIELVAEDGDSELQAVFDEWTMAPIRQSMPEIEEFLETKNETFRSMLIPSLEKQLSDLATSMIGPVSFEYNRIHFIRIREQARIRILKWALDIEEAGVLGEGMSFSKQEIDKMDVTKSRDTYHIGNQTIVSGGMNHSQIQQGTIDSNQSNNEVGEAEEIRNFVLKTKKEMMDWPLVDDDRDSLSTEIGIIEAAATAQKPKLGVAKECLKSAKTILEGAAGGYLATAAPMVVPAIAVWAAEAARLVGG